MTTNNKTEERQWTPEQEEAIGVGVNDGATVVSAAAGSGKTAVIIERVKRLLLDRENSVAADSIVVATFTNKAAAEIVERLDRELKKAREENADDESFCRLVDKQLLLLSEASVSTINSFCLGIIRKNSAALGVSPNFSILDESSAEVLRKKAVSQIIEEFCEKADRDEVSLIYDWLCGETDEELEKTLLHMHDFYRGLTNPEEYFSRQISSYEEGRICTDDTVQVCVSEIKSIYEDMAREFSGDSKREAHLEKWKPLIGNLSEKLTEENKSFILGTKLPVAISKDESSKYYKGEIEKRFKMLTEYLSLEPCSGEALKACAPVLRIIVGLIEKLDARYTDFKREKNKLDFSDTENIVLKILRGENGGPSAFAKELSEKFSIIIVDEFQDSNDIQYEIFRLISRDKKNLYFVGDIKQSIYAFRGANPKVFLSVMRDKDFRVINLNRNFRSNSQVITSANEIFEKAMTESTGDVDYDDSHKLVQGRDYESGEENRTEMVVFSGESSDIKKTEAEYIAARIRSMVESGFKVTKKDGEKRCCQYGDFAILMAKYSKDAHIYTGALEKAGIPYEAKDDKTFTSFLEVRLAMSLLRIIDNPYKNTDMAAVLISEPYLFSADEMAQIKLKSDGGKHKHIYSGLIEKRNNRKIDRFLEEFEGLREFSKENTVEALARHIYDESLLACAVRAMPQGKKRDANLKMLIRYAADFAEITGGDLCDFIEYIDNIEKKGIKLTARDGGISSEHVNIMTIHGSKGLEFPICFVSNLIKRKKANTSTLAMIACDRETGIGMKYFDKEHSLRRNTLMYRAANNNSAKTELSESVRLLYVAATRAKEKLIFTATRHNNDSALHFGWVNDIAQIDGSAIDYYENPEIPKVNAEKQSVEEAVLNLRIGEKYRYERLTVIPSKVTATEIGVKGEEAFSEYDSKLGRFLRLPSFVSEKAQGKLTGKKKGDAYHKAMELIDFGGKVSQLDVLYEDGKLTEAERISIDDGEIQKFLGSEICARAVRSGDIHKEYPIFCECPSGIFGLSEDDERPFIQGIADMFFVENGEIVLVDYKTNANTTPEKLRKEYEGQLRIYKNALEETTGMTVKECLLYSFSLGCTVAVD